MIFRIWDSFICSEWIVFAQVVLVFTVPKVLAVVYSTYSSHAEENEEVVKEALQTFKASLGQAGEPEAPTFRWAAPYFVL